MFKETSDYLDTLALNGEGRTSLLGTVTAIYDVGTTTMSVGAIPLITTAFGVPQLIVGRIVGGIGNGFNIATAPVWQAKTSKAAWRGELVVIEMIGNIDGFSLSNWVTYGFSFVSGPVSWKMPLVLQFIFITLLFPTVPWLPESPRWLIAHGDIEQAEQIVADLEATTVDNPWLVTECECQKVHVSAGATTSFTQRSRLGLGLGRFLLPVLHLLRHPLARSPLALSYGDQFTNWAFKFMVVEITPIGIQTLHWRFYIIWTVFNAAFVPIVYLLYPETAGKTLEDIDRFFREDAKVIVVQYKDATSEKRPLKYVGA
ncbi:MAG: hypothetical protein LQ341_001115 [Variospora aurantia]|nr:MAG: hypothetical protein LQ341_001115 [Variospora aurantia]